MNDSRLDDLIFRDHILGIRRATFNLFPAKNFIMVISFETPKRLIYLEYAIVLVKRAIKPDVAPGEFKCRTCEVMWSSFRETNSPCTDNTLIRNGLHDFDFATPIMA